jgi:predicted nucleic acid-binding protein
MIVADTNLLVSMVVDGPLSRAAEAARARDNHWIAPRLLRSEFLNSLAKYVVVAKTMDRDEAAKAFHRGLNLVLLDDQDADAIDVLNVCARSGLTSYDAEFVALARRRNARLVTLDKAILNSCPDVAVSIEDFAAGR